MSKKILTVTLNPAIDRIVSAGKKDIGKFHAGGKGINVARAARALGLDVKAVGVEGGVTGWMLEGLLKQEGLPHQFFVVHGATRINTTRIARDGAVTRDIRPGPVLQAAERKAFAVFFARQLKGCAAVVFSGSLPSRFPVSAFVSLIRCARRNGALVAVDTSGKALAAAIKEGVDVIKPNREEAGEALGFRLSSKACIRKALRSFQGCGIKKALISLGEDGMAAFDGRAEVWVKLPAVRGGHGVGCGDAALAGFLAAQLAGKDFKGSVRQAAVCGRAAMTADKPGGIKRSVS